MDAAKRTLGFITIALAAIVVACGGGKSSNNVPAADDTSREITDEQLSQMVLALGDFGPDYGGFTADPENGVTNLDTASKDDFDPAGERADLETAGFQSGFNTFYQDQPAAGKPFFLGSGIHLFTEKQGAAQYVSDSRTELTEYLGKTIDEITIQSSTPFEVDIGDEAVGADMELVVKSEDGSSVTVWYTAAMFRRGRLIGAVAISGIDLTELDRKRLHGNAEGLAAAMNGRIASVLAAAPPAAAEQ